jgi:hypothetical protein
MDPTWMVTTAHAAIPLAAQGRSWVAWAAGGVLVIALVVRFLAGRRLRRARKEDELNRGDA